MSTLSPTEITGSYYQDGSPATDSGTADLDVGISLITDEPLGVASTAPSASAYRPAPPSTLELMRRGLSRNS